MDLSGPIRSLRPVRSFTRWQYATLGLSLLVVIPLGVVMSSLFSLNNNEIWRHLMQTVLFDLVRHTLWLMMGVGVGTTVLGVSLAWLTVTYDFFGKRFFDWSLLLPLAIPPYVLAFVMIGLLDYTGPVQRPLRVFFGGDVWFPSVRSLGGVIVVMTLAFYPYVYAMARNAFLAQGRSMMEAAQSLGHSRLSSFLGIALPMARPAIAGGVILALMETVSDFGTVSIFNYDTFTTAIYKAWFGFFSLEAAAQLASVLILIVFVALLVAERFHPLLARAGRNRTDNVSRRLTGIQSLIAFSCAAGVLLMAFVIPVAQLLIWALERFSMDFDPRFVSLVFQSLLLGGMGALLTSLCALVLAYTKRLKNDGVTRMMVRLSSMGYAMPGAVLAVGIFIPMVWMDQQMIYWGEGLLGIQIGFLLRGTLVAMMIGFLIRFMAVAYSAVDGEMQRISPSMDEAARCLGLSGKQRLYRVYVPMLGTGLLTAAMLVFVDVMKEMPITLMTRPFGWETLSVQIFELTSEGEWRRAALPSLALILCGLIPVYWVTRLNRQQR